jgi:hypothetical protein
VEADLARLQLTAEAETRRSMTLAKTEVEKSKLIADAYARDTLLRAEGDTKARTLWNQIEQQREAERIALWEKTPQRVSTAFAIQAAAAKLDKINHLNLTPDLLKTLVHGARHGAQRGPESDGETRRAHRGGHAQDPRSSCCWSGTAHTGRPSSICPRAGSRSSRSSASTRA